MTRRIAILVSLVLLVSSCALERALDAGATQAQVPAATGPSVLFVGNSYTYYNNMPEIVEFIAGANGVDIDVTMHAPGGAHMREHVVNPDVLRGVSSGEFDIVVLQEQSQVGAMPEFIIQDTIPAAQTLTGMANRAGARVVLFQTWGHEFGNELTGFTTYDTMQAQVIESYKLLADRTGARVARVGQAWQEAKFSHPELRLHDPDGTHPTPAGSYLAALIFANEVLDRPVTVAPDVTIGDIPIDAETAAQLLEIANTITGR